MGSMQAPVVLDVIVVGGGICGLAAAIALRRSGHHVTVYEKYSYDADAGAGLVVCANAVRVLRQWGLDPEGVGMLRFKQGQIIDGKSLQIYETVYGDGSEINTEEVNGESQLMSTRTGLRTLLRTEAEREVPMEGTIKFVYNCAIVDYDAERPAVKFADGAWENADLVVACDGVKSRAGPIICGHENPAVPTGFACFRFMVQDTDVSHIREKYKEIPMLKNRLQKDSGMVFFARQPQKLFVWWTSQFGEVHCIDALLENKEHFKSSEDWSTRRDSSIMLEEFSGFHEIFQDMIKAAGRDTWLWKICTRTPLTTIHKGKLVMLGDAAHRKLLAIQGRKSTLQTSAASCRSTLMLLY
jgi:salicylate hydroxylase